MKAFDEIGEAWDSAHPQPMPVLKYFLALVEKKGVVLDAGCGTGRHFALLSRKSDKVIGIDSSKKMIEVAEKKIIDLNLENVQATAADFTSLPFKNESFDYVFYLASIHHLPKSEQQKAFNEMHRVLKKDGLAFVTVWSRFQSKFELTGKEGFVSFKHAGKQSDRYYYFFDEEELKKLAEENSFKVKDFFFEKSGSSSEKKDSHNLCLILEK